MSQLRSTRQAVTRTGFGGGGRAVGGRRAVSSTTGVSERRDKTLSPDCHLLATWCSPTFTTLSQQCMVIGVSSELVHYILIWCSFDNSLFSMSQFCGLGNVAVFDKSFSYGIERHLK